MQTHRLIGMFGGPACALAALLSGPPEGLSEEGWRVATVAGLMAIWWMTEAAPLAATALLPLALLPLLGLGPLDAIAVSYAHPLIFLFLGGFLLARAMQTWRFDQRLALVALSRTGSRRSTIIAVIMGVTAFLSMWISNTASAMVMLPLGVSIIAVTSEDTGPGAKAFASAMMLGIAYAATIGGMATLIGTPPNAFFAAYMETTHGVTISFARWLLIGLPLVLALLPLAWLVLTKFMFRVDQLTPHPTANDQLAADLARRLAALGSITRGELLVASIMCIAVFGWIFRPLLDHLVPQLGLSDAGISITCALVLFLLPVDLSRGRFALSWREASGIRWDVLILFGGGLALATAIGGTDLPVWLGIQLEGFQFLPMVLLIPLIGVAVVLLGEVASNTAMAAILLPIAGATALSMGVPVVSLALPVALFATLGFMLPVATPPNAIVFGSGAIEIGQMVRAGMLLDSVGILVVSVIALTLGQAIFA